MRLSSASAASTSPRGGCIELVADFLERFLGRVDQARGLLRTSASSRLGLIGRGHRFGIPDHAIDFVFGEIGRCGDRDLLFLAGAEIFRADVHDAVGIDVERDFDLRNAARRGREPFETEASERLVVARHLAFALEHVDVDRRLAVFGRREDLRLARRDRRVALDQFRLHAAERFEAERERGHVEQHDVVHFTGEHAGLNRGTDGHDFVGVDRWFSSLPVSFLTSSWITGMRVEPPTMTTSSIFETSSFASASAFLNGCTQRSVRSLGQLFELGARQRDVEVLRTVLIGRDERQVDVRLDHRARARSSPFPRLRSAAASLAGRR